MTSQTFMVLEGTQYAMEGESFIRSIRVPMKDGSTPTLADSVMYVYKNGTNVTSTYTTGSMVETGDLITTKTFQSLVGGDNLNVVIFATVNGVANQCVAEFPMVVRKLSGR